MATPSQIEANRQNAQRSTGPKTPEGKAVVAQNAVTHGLRTSRTLIASEDPNEFERFRTGLLEELAPVGPMEAILAGRIVTLTWQLSRAAALQTCAINTLLRQQEQQKHQTPELTTMDYLSVELMDELGISEEEHYKIVDEKGYAGFEEHVNKLIRERQLQGLLTEDPQRRSDRLLGEVIFADFSRSRALERLAMYERRIESSLYRTHLELKRLQLLRLSTEN